MPKPSVLFICVHNAGKSQTAEALLKHKARDTVTVFSGGTEPDEKLAADAVLALKEIGVGVEGQFPKDISDEVLRQVDHVIILGNQAKVNAITGMKAQIETWQIVEPKELGIQGPQRAQLIREDISARVDELIRQIL